MIKDDLAIINADDGIQDEDSFIKRLGIWFVDAAKNGNVIYFSGWNLNGIFSMNLDSGKVEFIAKFPGFKDDSSCTYSLVQRQENSLYFFPHRAKQIVSFDLNSRKMAFYETVLDDEILFGDHHYVDLVNHAVWLLVHNGKQIVCFDTIHSKQKIYNFCNMNIQDTSDHSDFVRSGNCLWYLYRHTNQLVQFDMGCGEFYCHSVGSCNWTGLSYDDENFFLIDETGSVYRWDNIFNNLIMLKKLPNTKEPYQMIFRNGWLFVFYLHSMEYIAMNSSTLEIKVFPQKIKIQDQSYFSAKVVDNDIFLFTHGMEDSFLRIREKKLEGEKMKAVAPIECNSILLRNCIEGSSVELIDLCNLLARTEAFNTPMKREGNRVNGMNIYREISCEKFL